jgi:hypothetical protein
MSLIIYPHPQTQPGLGLPGVAYTVKWTPVFFNQTFKAVNGASIDIGLASAPLHNFELKYEFLRNQGPFVFFPGTNFPPPTYSMISYEFRRLMGFFLLVGGTLGRFAFENPDDNQIYGQFVASTDGVTKNWVLQRTLADESAYNFSGTQTEPIGVVALSTVTLYFDGTPVSGATFSIANTPGNVILTYPVSGVAPAGHQLTIDMKYYYYCKFTDDSTVFEKFSEGFWSNASVKIQSCRAGA